MANLDDVLQDLASEVSGFIATDVVDLESGMSIAGYARDPEFNGSMASAAFTNVLESYREAFDLLELDPDEINDIMGTTDDLMIFTRPIGDRRFYHGLAISTDGNLALARMKMGEYEDKILDAISL
jgi:predicted regulator of Ras-like GTPase activity (Roadblock/LC7/MglB family)